MEGAACEVTTIGGKSPQWLVNRAAGEIADGNLTVTLIAGSEAIRSSGVAVRPYAPPPWSDRLPPDPVVGDDRPGVGPAESASAWSLPIHVYPLFESVVASRAGHDAASHRAPWAACSHRSPRWRRPTRSPGSPRSGAAEAMATPTPDNRMVCEPYTKRMTAFLGSDQGAALVVCSLAAARRAGVAERAVFVWSGPRPSMSASRWPARPRSVTGHRRCRPGPVRRRRGPPGAAAGGHRRRRGCSTSTRASLRRWSWPPRRWAWPATTRGG